MESPFLKGLKFSNSLTRTGLFAGCFTASLQAIFLRNLTSALSIALPPLEMWNLRSYNGFAHQHDPREDIHFPVVLVLHDVCAFICSTCLQTIPLCCALLSFESFENEVWEFQYFGSGSYN
ncbi:hypothetical protein CEXT_73081 [Caerostris extrusa]|uniref:Uncharacterized protein n=1 Tax=Caerostris extrusa TaxID=172846 RepID=A0AAV4NF04_CAEEX|nr:hypothetical protein CEXT_73081 [Caerostris extrusa]